MKSYKQYTKQAEEAASAQTGGQTDADEASAAELAKRLAAAYNGKSNLSMLRSILEEAEKSKKAGTLSNAEIERFYQSFSPMLNGYQKRQLREVVERLKQI